MVAKQAGLEWLILVVAAAVWLLSAVVCGSGFSSARVLNLERVFPADQRVRLDSIRARDRARHARILQTVVGGVVNFKVIGSSDPYSGGLYYTKVKLGSPPKEFNVQIDSGSDILWVTCSSCSDCPQTSAFGVEFNFFDAASSSTASPVYCSDSICSSIVQAASAECSGQDNQCGYSFQYQDGSATSGHYIADLVSFETILGPSMVANSSASIIFGCSTYQSGDLTKSEKTIDGIIGFGKGELSIISQLSSRRITPKVFSHCLRGDGSGGGKLVLGEILDPSIVYSPLVSSQSHYNLDLQSIAVNGQLLPIDAAVFASSGNQGTIVDTGTTLTYLPEEAYDPFISAINAAVSGSVTPILSGDNHCYILYASTNEIFPLVSLNFAGGASMILKPENYLIQGNFNGGGTGWCIGFLKTSSQGLTILGDIVLKDKIFVYDLEQQRIGWADYNCSAPVNVSITTGRDEFIAGQLSVSSVSKSVQVSLVLATISALLVHILVPVWFL